MYHVSAQGVDERMINVRYYYYYLYNEDDSAADNPPPFVLQMVPFLGVLWPHLSHWLLSSPIKRRSFLTTSMVFIVFVSTFPVSLVIDFLSPTCCGAEVVVRVAIFQFVILFRLLPTCSGVSNTDRWGCCLPVVVVSIETVHMLWWLELRLFRLLPRCGPSKNSAEK